MAYRVCAHYTRRVITVKGHGPYTYIFVSGAWTRPTAGVLPDFFAADCSPDGLRYTEVFGSRIQ